MHTCVPNPPHRLMLLTQLFPGLLGLPTKEHIDLLFNPVFVVRLVCLGICLVHKAAEVCQVIYKIKQLADTVCDRGTDVIHSLHMFLRHFTDAFHAFIHRFIVGVNFSFWPLGGLYQQNGVRHAPNSFTAAAAGTPHFLFLSEDAQLGFSHLSAICEQCCYEYECANKYLFKTLLSFLKDTYPEEGCWIITSYFQLFE